MVKLSGGDVRYDVKNGSTGLNSRIMTNAHTITATRVKSDIAVSLRNIETHVITPANFLLE